jgi:elongation factor P
VERASLEQHEVEFLYKEGRDYHFMNTESYEQFTLSDEALGDNVYYLIPNIKLKMEFNDGNPVGTEMPLTVDLRVVTTEPGLKSATATNSGKPATLETGLVVQVPQFIAEGEVIRVDTAEGKYLERAK